MKINKDTRIEDIVTKYPQLVKPLREYGIVCIACGEPIWGTLGEQIEEKKLSNGDEIIQKMNLLVEEE